MKTLKCPYCNDLMRFISREDRNMRTDGITTDMWECLSCHSSLRGIESVTAIEMEREASIVEMGGIS